MSAHIEVEEFGQNRLLIHVIGAASTANGGQGSIKNPFGKPVLIRNSELLTKTPSTGAANISAGIGAATAAPTDVINAAAVNGLSAGHIYNCHAQQVSAKTAISAPAIWTAATYFQITASATMVGYEGWFLLDIVPLPEYA
jgi:hypothetical protein